MGGTYPRTGTLDGREPVVPEFGQEFGHWTFLSLGSANSRYLVKCVCGIEREVRGQDVHRGRSRSCGCRGLGHKSHTTGGDQRRVHGTDYGFKLYRTWRNAKNRVSNPRAEKFSAYGGSGISMHQEWFDSYEAFARDVGEPPSPLHSLDREDGTKGYEPGNVRWATPAEQVLNRRNTVRVEFQGVVKPLKLWCEELDLSWKNAKYALSKGKSFEEFVRRNHAGSQ